MCSKYFLIASLVGFFVSSLVPLDRTHATEYAPVQVSHHRGALEFAPENTLAAFEKSIELGADYIEFDIQRSKDGVYYLLHDRKLDRTTNGKGPIFEKASAEIAELDAGSWFSERFQGEKVPTLEEFLDRFAGRVGLYVDAKNIDPEDLAQALRQHEALESSVVYGSVDYLVRLREIEPRIRALAPLSDIADIEAIHSRLDPFAFDCSWDALTQELIDRAHSLGIRVFSDAMGEHEKEESYLQAMEWGIDLIQTDRPLKVKRAIEKFMKEKMQPRLIQGGQVRQTEPAGRTVMVTAGSVEIGGETFDFPTQTFEIPPEPLLDLPDQTYLVRNWTEQKSPSHWDGEGPRGPGTTRSYQRLVPGSLVVSSTDGSKTHRPDVDYIYDYYWGSIKPASGGEIAPNSEVSMSYRCYRCRYDAIVIDPRGAVAVVRGESMPPDSTELLLPNPPEIPATHLRLANIFTGWTNTEITQGSIGVFEPTEGNSISSEKRPVEVAGRYDDILPRNYLVEIVDPGPTGIATYHVAASGDPYGVDAARTIEEPVFGPVTRTSAEEATPLLVPVSDGRTADYSLRIDFRPLGETSLAKGDRWTLRAEPRMIFPRTGDAPDLFPKTEIESQRGFIPQTLSKLERGENLRVVFLGESTTAGGSWPTRFARGLQDLYPRSTVEGINVGIGGETILGGLPRLEQDVFSKDPDLVVVEYIINDSGVNFRDLDSDGPGRIETAHRELLEKIRERGGIEVVYLTANMGNPAFVPAYSFENFRRTSDLYRDLCQEFGCAFVDAFRVWENMPDLHGEYFITRLKGNMVNHPYGNRDKAWSADRSNSDWLLKLFEPTD